MNNIDVDGVGGNWGMGIVVVMVVVVDFDAKFEWTLDVGNGENDDKEAEEDDDNDVKDVNGGNKGDEEKEEVVEWAIDDETVAWEEIGACDVGICFEGWFVCSTLDGKGWLLEFIWEYPTPAFNFCICDKCFRWSSYDLILSSITSCVSFSFQVGSVSEVIIDEVEIVGLIPSHKYPDSIGINFFAVVRYSKYQVVNLIMNDLDDISVPSLK